ncbi:unnamed protein product (macronuclear) [Paramecium tetraurelia]|uniref:Uncharacterized protein n=1 Tax=Paramecium tetraurelia TaxID=5888 RepID=A0BU69_PARTE|nr:uncharacterized protein GSPATT00032318001 [Paramecium tetraurelia]CAK62086.1 unnamed protein product [Paramecium tetraurelia]|eukprot:XP_001429484.1 hypothetical protein (macronuclear) [Paramecium tetraurelia strain d4-2]
MQQLKLSNSKENQDWDFSKVESRIQLLIEENQRLNQSLTTKMEEIQQLKTENNHQLMELNKFRGQDCEQKILTEIILQKTTDCDKNKRQLLKAEKSIDDLEQELSILKSEKDQYSKQMLQAQTQNILLEQERLKQIDELKTQVRKSNQGSNNQIDQLKFEVNKSQLENDSLKVQLKQLQDENSSIKRHLGCLSGYILENEQLRKENESLNQNYQALLAKQ